MNEVPKPTKVSAPWKLLIVDDDPDVHAATRMALRGVEFRGRALAFMDAYSGDQALEVLQENPDTALIFMDVIMETDDAGLRATLRIRESGFTMVRIIVRTGFPGQAPERQVIVDYDIHDYKEKTGLSAQKLFTSVVSALRAYDDLVALDDHRRGLMGVLDTASSFDFNAVQRYVARMLAEFTGLARLGAEDIVALSRPSDVPWAKPSLLASLGTWQDVGEPGRQEDLSPGISQLVMDAFAQRKTLTGDCGSALYTHNSGVDLVVFATGEHAFAHADEVMLEMFLMHVCQAVGNQRAFTEMKGDRDAVLRGLALRGERWDARAASELDRLAHLATELANRLHTTLSFGSDVDARFIRCIGIASMLHDMGNDDVMINLLAKKSAYDQQERKRMQAHVQAGVELVNTYLLDVSEAGALGMARDIIGGHHEYFDGSGYPHGLAGDAIPLAARVVAVADVYVAMTSQRPHRSALDPKEAQALIQQGAGKQFDPRVVEAFLDVVGNGVGH